MFSRRIAHGIMSEIQKEVKSFLQPLLFPFILTSISSCGIIIINYNSDYQQYKMTNEKKPKYRHSRQRQRILELLRATETHPTANWIYDELRKEFPNLSMGNVYRNLSILIEQGLVGRIDFGSTFDRFDANIDQHYHFLCEECGTIVDLKLPVDDQLNDKVNETTNLKAQRHNIQFYGLCDKCAKHAHE